LEAGTRKFATIVVVILLVLGGLLGALFLSNPGIADDEDNDGWSFEDDNSYTIDGDARWIGWNLTLDGVINVDEGGSLLLEDSRIEVTLERLSFSRNSTIWVDEGATMELRNSELVITAEPQLGTAWVCYDDYYGGDVPNMWRVVNLQGTTSPILEFDVELWSDACRIVVAVQVNPDAEVEILDVFGSNEVGWREWNHVEVQLDDYIGTTPRVVVFVDCFSEYHIGEDLLLNDLRVSDGDGPLPGDLFMTGNPIDDGWYVESFQSFSDYVSDNGGSSITSLLVSLGDLRVVGSIISGPISIARTSDYYRPHLSDADEEFPWSALVSAISINGIWTLGGSLTILDSEVSYVPICGSESTVEIDGTVFIGNNAMTTLSRCEGSITRSSFTSEYAWEFQSLNISEDLMWQVAIEDVHSPGTFLVEDCTFSGFGMDEGDGYGLHLNNADIRPIGCTFDNHELAFWNHEGDKDLDWDAVTGSNSFGENCAYWYIDTQVARLEYEGSGQSNFSHSNGNWGTINFKEDLDVPFIVSIWRDDTFDLIFAPILLTGPVLGVVQVDNLTVRVYPRWGDGQNISFDPHNEVTTFWIPPKSIEIDNPYFGLLLLDHERGFNKGRVLQVLEIYLDSDYHAEPVLDLYLDGLFIGRPEITVIASDPGSYYSELYITLTHDIAIPVGLHQVTLTITSFYLPYQTRAWVGDINITFLRFDEDSHDIDTSSLFEDTRSVILVDPGVDQEAVELIVGTSERFMYSLTILTWNGSRIVLETIDFGNDSSFNLYSFGPGEVVIGNVSTYYFYHLAINTSTVYQGAMEGMVQLMLLSSDVVMKASIRGWLFYMDLSDGSDLLMEGSIVDYTAEAVITIMGSNATIADCTFTAIEGSTPFHVEVNGNSSMWMNDCVFQGASMYASPRDPNCTLYVRNCTFTGPGSYLLLLNDERVDEWDDNNKPPILPMEGEVSGNIFEGPGTGLVFNINSRNGYLGPNIFNTGAKAMALFTPGFHFIDESYGCYTYVTEMIATPDLHDLDFISYHYRWRGFWFLVDMTDDPLNGEVPKGVPILIKLLDDWSFESKVVVEFDRIPVDGDLVTVNVPMWPPLQDDLFNFIHDPHIPGSWWKDT